MNHSKLINQVKKSEIKLISPSVDILKAFNKRTFKEILKDDFELLQQCEQRITYFILDEEGSYGPRDQRNANLFDNAEIKSATEIADVMWIPIKRGSGKNAKTDWIDANGEEGQDFLKENPEVDVNSIISSVYKIPAIGGFDFRTGELVKPTRKYHYAPAHHLYAKWHAIPAKRPNSKTKSNAKGGSALIQLKEMLVVAKKKNLTEKVLALETTIARVEKSMKKSIRAGAKGAAITNDDE